ncbi:MAG: helix-turn-helix transcriptional regulator [Planctomycetota bacterium]|nr:helix-turn-helix transcriptional regulator [Planctomycetota bacterium]
MIDNNQIRKALQDLREEAGMSQAELAKKLPFTASRVSRLESGDLGLTTEEAQQIAGAIGTPKARDYAAYLSSTWRVLPAPGFNHISRQCLWDAESALQRLDELKDDPDLRNVFLKQVDSCRNALEKAAGFLAETEHPIAFIGSPGVGKTTAICSLANLRDQTEEDLDRQMTLQTGGGRVTVCEVHLRNGGEWAISVDPSSEEEMRQYVAEFCDHVISLTGGKRDGDGEGPGLNSEIDRALRNMTGLQPKKIKVPEGKSRQEDPARELATQFPRKEDLQAQVFTRLDLARRRRTSITFPRDSTMTGHQWLQRTFADINYGHHPEFSLPRRIEISIPTAILDENRMEIRLIDTRGVDEPKAPRRDLQAYLDDDRAVIVFCSSFKDAPGATALDVVERAMAGGLRQSLKGRAALLILPQNAEELKARDPSGAQVGSIEDGRDVKKEQVQTTFSRLGIPELRVEFLDVTKLEDCRETRRALVTIICSLRNRAETQIRTLCETVDRLIANKADEQVRAVFEEVARRIGTWVDSNSTIPAGLPQVEQALLAEMDELRYASSLRASVNRRGDWYNFDYWHGLGYGARCEVVERTEARVRDLKAVVTNLLADPSLAEAHGFLRHFETVVDQAVKDLCETIQAVGEAAFSEQLREDHDYWGRCRDRWGGGSGYKIAIRGWTGGWFSEERRQERREFIEAEMQRRWTDLVGHLNAQIASAKPEGGTT